MAIDESGILETDSFTDEHWEIHVYCFLFRLTRVDGAPRLSGYTMGSIGSVGYSNAEYGIECSGLS